jgi:predicted acylesterase/phospholipase RssA
MTHPFATDLLLTVLQPWNLFIQLMTSWDRTDVLAESFRVHLYSGGGRTQTFASLLPNRPHLLINATDLQTGRRFVFCNESFDALKSNFAQYPLSHAVAASSAVPGLLHHVTLRDFSYDRPHYVHVLDGGIIDNLGVSTLVEVYADRVRRDRAAGRADPYPGGMILLVIDAHTTIENKLSETADVGLIDALAISVGLSSTALLNRASSATMAELIVQYSPDDATAAELRRQIKELTDEGSLVTVDAWRKPLRVVHLALPRVLELNDKSAVARVREVNNIATYFNIGSKEAADLYSAAELLVEDERFARPLQEIAEKLKAQPTTHP